MSSFSLFERSWLSLFYKPLLLPFFALAASRSERTASTFFIIQFQWLKQSVVSPLPLRQKAPLRQGFQRPPVLNEPPALFYNPVPAARMFGGFASSCEAENASTSEAPSPSHSERAASTFYSNSNTPAAPIPPPIHIVTIPNCSLRRFIS